MEAIKNLKLVEAARTEARALVENYPTLSVEYSLIHHKIIHTLESLYME